MPRKAMLQLANRAAELLVDWNTQLPDKDAWEGDFQQALADQLMVDPLRHGRPAAEVLEQVAHEMAGWH